MEPRDRAAEDKARQRVQDIWALVQPVIQAEGLRLIEVEYRREPKGWVLRLFIDREDGVTVDDCARISQVVGDLLDVADPIPTAYHLEVSSPGLNRPLRRREHFVEQVGNVVQVRTVEPLGRRRNFKGLLTSVGEDDFTVECDGQPFCIAFDLVERARLCYFESQEKRS